MMQSAAVPAEAAVKGLPEMLGVPMQRKTPLSVPAGRGNQTANSIPPRGGPGAARGGRPGARGDGHRAGALAPGVERERHLDHAEAGRRVGSTAPPGPCFFGNAGGVRCLGT